MAAKETFETQPRSLQDLTPPDFPRVPATYTGQESATDTSEPGGRFMVNGRYVDANGQPLEDAE
jgi:protocatechuate 3,4-dioxygenase beta subunit